MKLRFLIAAAASLALSVASAGPARAASMVSGWDFSQYVGAGFLSTDFATFTNTLGANYADLETAGTFAGVGPQSGAFGTMYMDGSNGSTNVAAGGGAEQFLPSSGSLVSNVTAPAGPQFGSSVELLAEGQSFFNDLTMQANSAVSVVFSADLTSVPEIGSDWSVSFGAKTTSGTAGIQVDFSTDGANYGNLQVVNIDTNDTPYSVNLGTVASQTAFVRFTFVDPGNLASVLPLVDNLGIFANLSVPEPGAALLLVVGLAGLGVFGRRRSA